MNNKRIGYTHRSYMYILKSDLACFSTKLRLSFALNVTL